jgi:DNA-binding MarR family transcriptional regulator
LPGSIVLRVGSDLDRIDLILEQWHRERPDLDVAPLATVGRLIRTAELADERLARGLASHGLQPGWFDLLAPLRRAGAPFELTPTALKRATMLSSGGITKRLDRLETSGLVERRPDPGDRRGILVRLTSAGKATIDAAIETHLANERRLLGALTPWQRDSLDRLLKKLLASIESEPATA